MEYILIPTKNKTEKIFFLDLLKKMQKEVSTLSSEEMEDAAFITALRAAERSGKGSIAKVKSHLSRIASAE